MVRVSEAVAAEEVVVYEDEGFAATDASHEYTPPSLLWLRSETVSVD